MKSGPLAAALICLTLVSAGLAEAQAPAAWNPVGIGGGGAFFAPSFNPYNANELTLGCDMSGQYRSGDLGLSWSLTPFRTIQSGRTDQKVQYTQDPKTLYNIDFSNDQATPVVSYDGGQNWARVLNDPTGGGAFTFLADPSNQNRLLLADYNNLYYSRNGGWSWAQVASESSASGLHVCGAVFDGPIVFVATQHGILESVDQGHSFFHSHIGGIPASEGIVSFSWGRSATGFRFYCVTQPISQIYGGILGDDCAQYANVYTVRWGQPNWSQVGGSVPSGDYPFYVGAARNNPDVAYLAGGSANGVPIVLKTVDDGATWKPVFLTSGNANIATGWSGSGGDRDWTYGELVFGLDVSPVDSNRVAITDYGFCHISTDGGSSWRQVYVSAGASNPAGANTPKGRSYTANGLENTSCWWLAWADCSHIWASYSDIRGVRSVDGAASWAFDYSGQIYNSSYQALVQPATGVMYVATSTIHDMYESTHLTDASIDSGRGQVLYSSDQGKSWFPVGNLNQNVVGLALDPNNPTRLYATVANSVAGGIYECLDATKGEAAIWTKLPSPARTEGHANSIWVLNDGTIACSFSGRRTSNFTDSSGVFLSTDGGQTWIDRSDPNMHWWTRDLIIDPTDRTQNTWYAGVYSGWGGVANNRGGLYRSTDRGKTWTNILQLDRVGSCAINPLNHKEVFAATETGGLYFSIDVTQSSPVFTEQDAYPFRHPQRIFFNPYKPSEVWVTSFGDGIRVGTMSGP